MHKNQMWGTVLFCVFIMVCKLTQMCHHACKIKWKKLKQTWQTEQVNEMLLNYSIQICQTCRLHNCLAWELLIADYIVILPASECKKSEDSLAVSELLQNLSVQYSTSLRHMRTPCNIRSVQALEHTVQYPDCWSAREHSAISRVLKYVRTPCCVCKVFKHVRTLCNIASVQARQNTVQYRECSSTSEHCAISRVFKHVRTLCNIQCSSTSEHCAN